jgi:glycosyltransferase involved in cell wall biosynthesis
MRILTVLTYYRPHTSGLTIYAERLAKALVRRGHQVTILTSQYDPALPREDVQDGVKILRSPVLWRVSKGVIMPTFGWMATRLVTQNDVVLLHLPQFDAPGIALRGRLMNKPTVITYHSDLLLPPGIFNRAVNGVVTFMNDLAGVFTHKIVAYTEDFARHSPYLSRFARKIVVIPPPVEMPPALNGAVEAFACENNPDKRHPVIGMAARFAAEKGVEVLLEALPRVLEKYPNAMVLFSGQYKDVMGEEAYARRLFPLINRYEQDGRWRFLGVLNLAQMAAFFPNLDALVVPSLNSTETFGLVQIEAMMNGVPSVASDLPGVRQPVLTTGMGRIAPIGDAEGLAQALLEIFSAPEKYTGDSAAIAQKYSPDSTAAAYEALFEKMLRER